ncbi:MAG: hypothetical protein JWP78_624 [Mucilaginibacter sp.]|nr:hypothetical protein [Mucilaginibacter sp.]
MTYPELVLKRKNYNLQIPGLINPSCYDHGKFDSDSYLEPWAKWQNSIPAEILVIGQDWGGVDYYRKNNGKDNSLNPTCRNLIRLFEVVNINIGSPEMPGSSGRVHFTNIIPFLRTGQMQGDLNRILNQKLINEIAEEFTAPLISIVKPRIIITLGTVPLRAVLSIFKIKPQYHTLKEFVSGSPLNLDSGLYLFPMYHCGSSGANRNRKLELQKQDWLRILDKL